MSGPFNVGDVVVCVDNGEIAEGSPGCRCKTHLGNTSLIVGRIYRVNSTGPGSLYAPDWPCTCETIGLGSCAGLAVRFRHLPRATAAFTAQMRALRPVKEPAL